MGEPPFPRPHPTLGGVQRGWEYWGAPNVNLQHRIEDVLMSEDGKQLMAEAVYLCAPASA